MTFQAIKAASLTFLAIALLCSCGGGGGGGGGGSAAASSSSGSGSTVTTPVVVGPLPPDLTGVPSVITMSLVAHRTSGVAPLAVFFDASGTTATSTALPFHEMKYTWSFGDTAGNAGWSYGSRVGLSSKNVAYGPVASHVFETPGTYTVTAYAFDGTNTNKVTQTITVTDPNTQFSGTNTICVANGSTPITGSGATDCPVGSDLRNLSTLNAITALATGSKRILLKRGDVWSLPSVAYINSTGPGIVGAYGTGAAPKIQFTTNNYGFDFNAGAGDWRVMDLELDGVSAGTQKTGFISSGATANNITILRVTGHELASAVSMTVNGLFVVDSNFYHFIGCPPGCGGVGIYTDYSSKVAVLGTRVYDATGIEHNIRMQGTTDIVLSNNTVAWPGPTKKAVTIRGRSVSGSPSIWSGVWVQHVVISDNNIAGVTSASGDTDALVQFAPQNTISDERVRDVIFERNYVSGNAKSAVESEAVSGVTIRNNIFRIESTTTYGSPSVLVMFLNTVGTPPPFSHYIYNNSFYQPSNLSGTATSTNFSAVGLQGTSGVFPTGTIVKNNLAYAPYSTRDATNSGTYGTFFSNGGASSSAYTLQNNTSDITVKSTSPNFAVNPPAALTDWKPGVGYAATFGTPVPVWDDFFVTAQTVYRSLGAIIP